MKEFRQLEFELGDCTRFQRFQELMCFRIQEVLLVSSLYDFFTLSEDGGLYELLFNEYVGLGLTHIPRITRVSSTEEAMMRLSRTPNRFDLIITSLHLIRRHAIEFAQNIKNAGFDVPVVLLTWDNRDREKWVVQEHVDSVFDKVFLWQGDFRIFLAIIKQVEDRLNIDHDTKLVGVQSMILIEDDARYYSSFLPMIYEEIVVHTRKLISEGVNQAHKQLRMRARPKIILCTNYEEAWEYFEKYRLNILGVISDIKFPRNGIIDPEAGFEFARNVKAFDEGIPVLLQSSDYSCKERSESLGAPFLQKDSDVLLHDLRKFIIHNLGFGDFVFRMRDGSVVGQARDVRSLKDQIAVIPAESFIYHARNNHFSRWLKARTEHLLAKKIRAHNPDHYDTVKGARESLLKILDDYFHEQQRGHIVDFDCDTFDPERSFARIGGGSLGGKARGLGFVNSLINRYAIENRFNSVKISVPSTIVLGTDIFDQFLDDNNLKEFAIQSNDEEAVIYRFLEASFRTEIIEFLYKYLQKVDYPLAVRSSSLLEDSHDMPFAGIYETIMLPNQHEEIENRLLNLVSSIKRVYASTFSNAAKTYIRSTPYRLEEEKMAVVIQRLIGTHHDSHFYPDFAGVVKSHNYYPIAPLKADDGIASVALGLGKVVVEGGACLRFCPKYPRHLIQFSEVDEILEYSQTEFFALEMRSLDSSYEHCDVLRLDRCDLQKAEDHEVLDALASTYCHENSVIYDSIDRKGARVITFAPILKYDRFPLARVLELLLELGKYGMSSPVEIEFAVNLSVPANMPAEFAILQIRPMVISQEFEQYVNIEVKDEDMICRCDSVLGNGMISDLRDIIIVDVDKFDRSKSTLVAEEIRSLNLALAESSTPYVLFGVGRWGSRDPWLGIPVKWDDISEAKVIVEADFKDFKVTLSQGSHFFHNITSSRIGYFTVKTQIGNSFIDWKWLLKQEPLRKKRYTRHVRLEQPLTVVMNSHESTGFIATSAQVKE